MQLRKDRTVNNNIYCLPIGSYVAIGVDLAAEMTDVPRPSQESQRQVSYFSSHFLWQLLSLVIHKFVLLLLLLFLSSRPLINSFIRAFNRLGIG